MRLIPYMSACCRRSGEVSTRIDARPGTSTKIDGRSRLSCGSAEVHTSHAQPMLGTPEEVPVPRKVMRAAAALTLRLRSSRQGMMMRDFGSAAGSPDGPPDTWT